MSSEKTFAMQASGPVKKRERLRGQALVELAILAPWIFFLFISVVDTGFCLVAVIGVQNAARAAALYTSSLSVTEIASVTYRAKKCVGMHFFNPVHKMKLLEIVRALETDDDTLATTVEVGKRMGKEVVVIKESPGFITSRINAMIGNEAFYMLQEGIASAADIDKALKLGLNHPMGPFELVDLVGLDTRLHILEYLHKSLGEKYRPAPLLVQYVKAGRLGRKSGRGVYEYREVPVATAKTN